MPRRVMELTPGALAVRSLREARLENMGRSRVGALAAVSRTGASEEGPQRMEVTEAQELGHGGDACVYAVGTVVRKEFFQPQAFHRELEALRAVSHECIVTLVGVCWESMHLYFPRFDCDLCAALLSGCPVDHKKCFASLLGALAALHRQNIVHRDVKPENLLVLETPSYVLCDFARSLALPAGRDLRITLFRDAGLWSTRSVAGSVWMPCGQFRGWLRHLCCGRTRASVFRRGVSWRGRGGGPTLDGGRRTCMPRGSQRASPVEAAGQAYCGGSPGDASRCLRAK